MKAEELRIGNWIYREDWDGLYETHIVSIKESSFYRVDQYKESFHPIPLTEELLIKFGYKLIVDSDYDRIWMKNNHSLYEFGSLYIDSMLEKEIESVHQLQNIYYIIEDKELEIKL